MAQNCLGKIRSYYARLSEKEKKIADYILENPEKIIHSTINELAEDLGVADATVFRFCKRIGFKGYQAMKIALASEVIEPIQQIHEEISENDSVKTVTEKVFKSNVRTLENTLEILNGHSIEKAVEFLLQANRVEFYGTGGSAVIAMDAFHKFVRTGIKAFSFVDSHFQLMSSSQLSENDVAVIISHSGTNKDTINIMKTAKNNGAKTIGITGYPKSPIAQNADVALFTSSEETEYRSEALSSRIGQLSLIDALYVNVMISNKNVANQSLERIRNAISDTRI
ncbi:MurR/RpiR family transcriptional regulator [Cytobacillus oceanisediminis]|jgi:DNA-binding MurR/RpiR family transcriptional regulator|uniref:MurR/RpiR family transcriptional regulator n=2 Tax=Niallia TaxID=2837506 RepID=A0A941JS93_NIACI|nr:MULTISPECIES: MurR/RpiR family transcriptional regulator [Bacillaceae]EOR22228.1 RpiR family transcriptional regulator [Niallia nealsonii AAU1]MBQ6448773.1 MurR/RpiR family transcriptional regulator [Bacillus sp. (in: firmicutes)]MDU1847032.1 MurR/RpiR family transcriptional regulator [Niallia nealsonii]MBZ9532959.1 MurR/RpiR family transcriptional regulator [Cytobacillus oceanisediminis]MCB5239264.1 MurR/RpiR family transcriptional regulator [Niallia circulans]